MKDGVQSIEDGFQCVVNLPKDERQAELRSLGYSDGTIERILSLTHALDKRPDLLEPAEHALDLTPSLQSGQILGDWRIEAFLGAGGMSEVYQACRNKEDFVQAAALKILRKTTATDVARFEQERRMLALLEHPGIARIIDGGQTADGQKYLVQEWVRGSRLFDYVIDNNLPARQRLRLFQQLCSAVSHAHGRLVLHRDVKPSNIMISDEGQVKLLDFGVATALEDEEFDRYHPITRAYSAPEQMQGGALSTVTDVYALGKVLRDLLILGAKTPRIPDDLRAIVDKCTQSEPELRYLSADALTEDVERYLANKTVVARPRSAVYRTWKFLSRNKTPAVLAALFVTSLIAGTIASLTQMRAAQAAELRANEAKLEQEFEARSLQGYRQGLMRLYAARRDDGVLIETELIDEAMIGLANAARDDFQPSSLDQAFVLYSMGQVMMFRYKFEEAVEFLEPLEGLQRESDLSTTLYIAAMSDLARSLVELEHNQRAEIMLRQLLEDRERYGLTYDLGHVQDALGLSALTERTVDQRDAELIAQKTLQRWEADGGDEADIGWLYNQLGTGYFAEGRIADAIEMFARAFELTRHDPIRSLSDITPATNLAQFQIYFLRDGVTPKQYLPAYLVPALDAFGAPDVHAFIHGLLAEAALLRGDWLGALEAAEAGLNYLEDSRTYRDGWYYNHKQMQARALAQLGRYEEAGRVTREALADLDTEAQKDKWPFRKCSLLLVQAYNDILQSRGIVGRSAFAAGIKDCRENSRIGWDSERVMPKWISELEDDLARAGHPL